MSTQRVLVIGAGPSGLVSLKTLREQGYDAVCFEGSLEVGGTFVNKANYDEGKLVSSKYITPFSDFRLPERYATEITPQRCASDCTCGTRTISETTDGILQRARPPENGRLH